MKGEEREAIWYIIMNREEEDYAISCDKCS